MEKKKKETCRTSPEKNKNLKSGRLRSKRTNKQIRKINT